MQQNSVKSNKRLHPPTDHLEGGFAKRRRMDHKRLPPSVDFTFPRNGGNQRTDQVIDLLTPGNQTQAEEALKAELRATKAELRARMAELRASKEETKFFKEAYNKLVLKMADEGKWTLTREDGASLSLDLGVITDEVQRNVNVPSVNTEQSSIDIAFLPRKCLQQKQIAPSVGSPDATGTNRRIFPVPPQVASFPPQQWYEGNRHAQESPITQKHPPFLNSSSKTNKAELHLGPGANSELVVIAENEGDASELSEEQVEYNFNETTRLRDRIERELKVEPKPKLKTNFKRQLAVTNDHQPKRIKKEQQCVASQPGFAAGSDLYWVDEVTELCVVEAILAHRVQPVTKEIQYLVKWRGMRHDANEWKSIAELSAHETVEEYNFEHGIRLEDYQEVLIRTKCEALDKFTDRLCNHSANTILNSLIQSKGADWLRSFYNHDDRAELFREQVKKFLTSDDPKNLEIASEILALLKRAQVEPSVAPCSEHNPNVKYPRFPNGLVIAFALFSGPLLHYYLECAQNFVRAMAKVFPEAKFHCHAYGLTEMQQASLSIHVKPDHFTLTEYYFDTKMKGIRWLVCAARFRTAFETTTEDVVMICDIHDNCTLLLEEFFKLYELTLNMQKQCGLTHWPSDQSKCPYEVDLTGFVKTPANFKGHLHTDGGLQVWLPGNFRKHLNTLKYWEFCLETVNQLRIISRGIDEILLDWFIVHKDKENVFKNAVFRPHKNILVDEEKMPQRLNPKVASQYVDKNTHSGNFLRIEERYKIQAGDMDLILCAESRKEKANKI